MSTQSFKDILAWQRAHDLTVEIYKAFAGCRDYGFRDQIQRASISIMNNIAEGHARRSDKAFRNFLFIAKGSTAEVESMLLVSVSLGYVSGETQKQLIEKAEETSRIISGFIRKLSAKDS